MKLNVTWKNFIIYIITTLLAVLVILSLQIYCKYQSNYINDNWETYKEQKLSNIAKAIKKKFNNIENKSYALLNTLISKTKLSNIITYWESKKSQKKIFKLLNTYYKQHDMQNRGIAIYNHLRECIGWYKSDINPSPQLLQECLNGSKFSTILKSGGDVFVILCTCVPIPHPKVKAYVGVAVSFLKLDINYPLSTRYIKSQSFAKQIQKQYEVQNIKIEYKNTPPDNMNQVDNYQISLLSLDNQQLGWIILKSLPKDITIQNLEKKYDKICSLVISILILFITIFLLPKIYSSDLNRIAKCLLVIIILLLLRYIFYLLDFPTQFLPAFLNSPEYFHSFIFNKWSDCLGNLLFSTFIFFAVSLTWLKIMPTFKSDKKHILVYILSAIISIMVTMLLIFGDDYLSIVINTIIDHASFKLFNITNIIPSMEALCIYLSICLLGFGFNFLLIWGIKNIINFRKLYSLITFLLLLLSPVIAFCFILYQFDFIYIFSPLLFVTSSLVFLKKMPKRYSLPLFFLIICIALFLKINEASRQKNRMLVEDYTKKFQEHFVSDTIELTLDLFETDYGLADSIEKEKNNTAFLLWAGSPLSERLDNIDILVYSLKKAENSNKQPNDSSQNYLKLISKFSLNMPNALWYHPLKNKLNLYERQFIKNIAGYNEGKNFLFYVAGVPIFNNKSERVGLVVLFARSPQIYGHLPLPEIFTKKKLLPVDSLLKAAYKSGNMFITNNSYIPKNFKPDSNIIQEVKEKDKKIWIQEKIGKEWYDNLYFLRQIKRWSRNSQKSLIEKNVSMLGYKYPSKIVYIFAFLQFFISAILFILIPIWLGSVIYNISKRDYLNKPFFSFEYKILLSFLLISGIPVFIMGYLSNQRAVDQIKERYKANLSEYLKNAARSMKEDTYLPLGADEVTSQMPSDDFCEKWGNRNRRMLNVYFASHPLLLATNRRELFYTELLPSRLSAKAYYYTKLLQQELYINIESIGNYKFVVGYKSIPSALNKQEVVSIISIPMVYRQGEVRKEISKMIGTVFTIYVGIFLLVMFSGIILAHQITRPLENLTQATQQVANGNLDVKIPVTSSDEFGQLVDSFNIMIKDLKISREKLIQAEKDAAWREMARQIAHEIKNPLTPMKLSAQHIRRAYNDNARNFSQILNKGISNIINAIVSLNKTASSFSQFATFIKPELIPCDLKPLIIECLELFANYSNIAFKTKIENDLPKILTDPDQFKRIIINLITNAIHAIEDKEGVIEIECSNIFEDRKKVLIKIIDNGCGVPEQIKPRLFDPNFSTKSHGSGLGLAICKRAMDHMSATISIDSHINQGTQVTLEFLVN